MHYLAKLNPLAFSSIHTNRHSLFASCCAADEEKADSLTLLHAAASLGHAALIQLLLLADPQLAMSVNSNGGYALHWAALGGHLSACKALLEAAPATATTRLTAKATPAASSSAERSHSSLRAAAAGSASHHHCNNSASCCWQQWLAPFALGCPAGAYNHMQAASGSSIGRRCCA